MNSRHDDAPPGACEEYEFDLVEFVDGTLPTALHAAVQRHLATCARCRAFERQVRAVDESLAAAIPRARLSAEFDERLEARIARLERSRDAGSARALAEREYDGAMTALRRGLAWRTALDVIGAAAVVGGIALGIMTTLPHVSYALDLGLRPDQTWNYGIGALAAAAGVLVARSLRRGTSLLFA
jgi:anti-sigma factor RsiW